MRDLKEGDILTKNGEELKVLAVVGKLTFCSNKNRFDEYGTGWNTGELERLGWKLEEPEWKPEIKEEVFQVDFAEKKLYTKKPWYGNSWDDCRFYNGIVFKTEEEVIAKAKSMLSK